jgi:ABC-type transport system substrate-binding protein
MHRTESHLTTPAGRRARSRTTIARWLAVLLGVALLAAACGGSDDDAGTTGGDGTTEATTSAGEVDPEGVIRIGTQLVIPSGVHLDPTQSATNPDRQWMELVFGTLLRRTADGRIEPWMVESYELVDPQTVTLTARQGVTFTDGTPYDAEAIKAGLERTLGQSSEVTVPSLSVAFKDITGITVEGDVVTITTATPQAGELIAALADREGVIVSPTQAADAPDQIDTAGAIGAGPYTVEEFTDGRIISLRKNPDFWDADSWQLGGVEYVQTADGAAQVNGLLSDTIDLATNLPTTEAERLEADRSYVVQSSFNDRSYIFINLCTGKPPYDDQDTRRALQVGIDRENVNQLVFGGDAQPAYGFQPEGTAYYDPEVAEIAAFDPEEAEELLGGETVPLDLYLAPGDQFQRVAEVLQAQLGDIGFDVSMTAPQDLVSEFITPQLPGGMLIPGSRTGVDKYARVFDEGQVQALCDQPRPEIVATVTPAAQLVPGDEEAASLFQEAEVMIAEGAYIIPIVFTPILNGWSDARVGGEAEFYSSNSQPMLDTFYVKA